jgi:hypothetical protein
MDAHAPKKEATTIILHDPVGDELRSSHVSHDHDTEVRHAWEHFWENARFFVGGFLPVILLTVIAFSVDFGSTPIELNLLIVRITLTGNLIAALVLAAARSALIAYFLSTLFKDFSFVFRSLCFTVFFLGGMVWLSLWDSEVMPGRVGDPIYNYGDPKSMQPRMQP